MNIGYKIRELRQREEMTQEELAGILNVSIQAVSRWENNQTFPDITLLPVLANIFNITVDELLDVDVYKKEEEINKILKEDDRLANIGDSEERIKNLKDALKKYPNSFKLMENLVHAMYGHYCGNPKEKITY